MNHWPFQHPADSNPLSGAGRFLVVDIETTGLLRATKDASDFHIITLEDYYNGEVFVFFDPYEKRKSPTELPVWEGDQDGYIADGVRMLMEAEALCFQNAVGFDGLILEKCFPWFKYNWLGSRKHKLHTDIFPFKLMDTMILSQLLNPDRPLDPKAYTQGLGNTGAHSIAAHGIRMGRHKPEHDDWSTLSEEMIVRNTEDVAIGRDMLRYLMEGDWKDHLARGANKHTGATIHMAYHMEVQVAFMIARQEQRGFRFDMQRAFDDYMTIDKEMEVIANAVDPYIPLRLETDPYNFDRLKKRYDSAVKNLDLSNYGKIYEFEPQRLGYIKELFNGIHRAMQGKPEDDRRIGTLATQWKLTTAKGDYSKAVQKIYPEMRGNINDTPDPLVAGAFTPLSFEQLGLGSLDYVKEKVLWPRGWLGINYSDSEQEWFDEHGEARYPWSGKIDDDSLKAWKATGDIPEWAEKIVNYYILRSRRSVILNKGDIEKFTKNGEWPKQKNGRHECRGLLAVAYSKEYDLTAGEYYAKFKEWPTSSEEEWAVPAAAFSIGTNTFRMRHRFVVNIPARGLFPLRHLFIARKGYKILGCDGAGLELRMLAHFMADAVYQEIILHGDIHTHNQLKAGLPTRDMAKTFIYAFLYGSGVGGLARLAGISISAMEQCIAKFKAELPALALLIERCEQAGRKFGYLQAIDGRWGRIRKKGGKLIMHTALNVLLQMTGSLVMKYGECIAEDQMIEEGVALDANGYPAFVANVHDEVQMEVPEDEVLYMEYILPYTLEGFPDERKAIKAVWDLEEKRAEVDEQGRKWSAPVKLSADGGSIHCARSYHRAGHILVDSFEAAGIKFNMRCPLSGEYKVGDNWGQTH